MDSLGWALHLHLSDGYHMNEPMHQKNKEGFGMQTKAPYDDGASKRGGLYFKSGKDACMSSNLKALRIFLSCYRKILNEVQQDCGQKESLSR
jgi:hypothetical protein